MNQQHPKTSITPARSGSADPAAATSDGFAALGVPAPIVASLLAGGIDQPFPIQAATLPDSLAGRDVLGRGRTGSGKTIAFGIPVVATLAASRRTARPGSLRALILVPTRELATQVHATLQPLAASMGLKTMTIFGGVGQGPQVAALRRGTDICIATPGRLEDLIEQRHVRLDAVEVTVLDEADHMADLGFLPAVKRLLDATPRGTQRLLFSATLDRGVDVVVKRYLSNPVTHSVDSAASEVPQMTHHVFSVSAGDKNAVVRDLVSGQGRTLAFTRTKHGAKKLAKQLTASGVPAVDLHGNLSQAARQRNLAAFGEGSVRVLVATDIAARGIHVDDVALVVHVDPPMEHKAYLHRSGRTARAGAEGIVVTVQTPDQAGDVRTLMRQAAIKASAQPVNPGDAKILAVTGPPAAFVTPTAPAPDEDRTDQRSGRGGSGRGGPSRGGSGRSASRPAGRSGSGRGDSPTQPATSRSARTQAAGTGGGRRSGAAPAGSTRGVAAFSAGRRRAR